MNITYFNTFYQYVEIKNLGRFILNEYNNIMLKNYYTESIEIILKLTYKKDFYYI
jgi:hypothetical protein